MSGIGAADVPGLTASLRERGGAFATKLELYQPRDAAIEAEFAAEGWLPAKASQYRFAVIVDLSRGSEAAFADMKKRARAEIRVGERNGVAIERGEVDGPDASEMIELVRATEERSGAFFRDDEYLRRVWSRFAESGNGRLYLARHDGQVVAGAFVVRFGRNAWYKDGGSTREFPHLMASRLLQWRIMQELAEEGVEAYDLGHVPPPGYDHPAGRGILIFKSAFASDIVEYLPAYLLPHEPGADEWRRGEGAFLAGYRAETGDYWY
ncbi:lipid II:glycine glycyltransferase FemX [Agromyces protaetiae]|uniref:lipid II:glycine glycyltransferase FemX n=1 Tax=Agromyces protaetiae TaxID=2509455 RepID=UPI0013EAD422|nr:GNAT family N-acetyltransferase [Agromyces protaetiae]